MPEDTQTDDVEKFLSVMKSIEHRKQSINAAALDELEQVV
jgi:hypothetical protein